MQQRRTHPTAHDRVQRRRPTRRPIASRGPNRDALYLAATIAILGVSLLAFAALIVAGADRLGGGDEGGAVQAGAGDQPPPAVGTPISVIPTPLPTATAVASPAVVRPLVCLDVGHGGVDLGNVRLNFDGTAILTMEKDLTLAQALDLRERLEAQGVEVVLTRETDTEVNASFADVNGDGEVANDVNGDGEIDQRLDEYPNELDELQARVNVCNEAGADLMVSLHVNSSDNVFLQGYEAYWADDEESRFVEESSRFALLAVESLEAELAAAGYEPAGRGAAPDSAYIPSSDDPRKFEHFVLLNPDKPSRNFVGADMPAVIVESLFLSNDDDYDFLTEDPERAQNAIVTAYERAILTYFADELAALGDEGELAGFGWPGATAVARPTQTPEAAEEASPTPTSRPEPLPDNTGTAQVHYYGDSGRREIALTFDLGSDRGYTEQILDFLAEQEIKASFGITGRWAEENADLVERIVDEGHMLINHTYSHRSFTGESTSTAPLTSAERIEEIERTHEIIYEQTGYDMRPYFRLTYGDGATDPQVMRDIYAADYYLVIMWTCDSYGWKQWTPAEIIQHCAGSAEPGGIILMHVGSDGTDQDALPGLVAALEEDGYDFVTVEEVLQP